MSSYSKLIIFIVVLVLISAALVFIESSTDSINKSMPEISDGIVQGDADYNEAVELVNNKNFYESMEKAESAGDNYNKSLSKLHEIQRNFSADVNKVHQEYITTTIRELELKLEAVDSLKEAIECFEVYSNYTGSNYGFEANDYMNQAVEYQHQRDSIVSDNPNLFKQNFIM
ncbi:MAG: hypothetical protein UIB31_04065 [Methanobrevibacter sp.]|uniref:hypothetical protein n=1 Tax=Methanobrevibacter sp. TaxID=66852 RepID=UPI0025D715E5|nr:hypothetical protein [Methanobrevibacter sp.]MEE0901684.1 hypothetical protein [Methanobrevibacter sp.]MEE0936256.1 hypothetical protein [Methanobrevibacter sp.]